MIVISCTHENKHKHGKDRKANPRYKCAACGQTFVPESANPPGSVRITMRQATMAPSLMLEGMSVRSVQHLTDRCRQTLADLVLVVGENCERFLAENVKGVVAKDVQLDEIWSFMGMREKGLRHAPRFARVRE